jgi:predicted dienelactone hydrolase
MYDPFEPGQHEVRTMAVEAADAARNRLFPCDIWLPDGSNAAVPLPLIVLSHSSGGNRKSATVLCSHLASHGYAVAAMNHSELVAAELAPGADETAQQRKARVDAVIASRVPDVRFLIDYVLAAGLHVDQERIGLTGHSFGGWTVLAVPEWDTRVRSVVAMGPGGSSHPRPGILPLGLTFAWGRAVPVLYLAAEDDVPIPLDGVRELFDRTPGPRRMFVLRRADHQHFLDDVEGEHEALRAMTLPGDAAWIPAAMRPMSELCSGAQAHDFVRGLTLAHLDATLRESHAAQRFLEAGADAALAARGVDAAALAGC